MPTVELRLVQPDYGFEARDEAGLIMTMDNSRDGGGKGYGVSPMQSLLMALGGCSGIDMVLILTRQRQTIDTFRMTISGEREKDKTPALWEQVHVSFQLTGHIDPGKARRAAELSIDKYCSVAETLRRAGCVLTWDVQVDEGQHVSVP